MTRTTYDAEGDTLSIQLRAKGKVHRTVRASDEVRVDFDADGHAIGILVLNAAWHLGRGAVDKLAPSGEELSLAEAGVRSGLSPTTLRVQIHNGRIPARKRGRDWVVEAADLENYLEAVESGRERQPAAAAPAVKKTRKALAR